VWEADRYLEITVDGETLSPRELVRSVPIAGMALTVPDGAIASRNARLSTGHVSASIPEGSTLKLTSDYQEVPGTEIALTPETKQTYLIYVTADLAVNNAVAVAQLHVDDNSKRGLIVFKSDSAGRGTVSQTYRVNLNPGSHTLVLKAKLHSGTDGRIHQNQTTITYLAVAQ
jgi:hypothetical protein